MTKAQALEKLKFHSGRHSDIDSVEWSNGFLPSLRPYKGLNRKAFDDLLECLSVLSAEIKRPDTLDTEMVIDLWTICHYSKAWGTDTTGMIRRNNLISQVDIEELEKWIIEISSKVAFWLEGPEGDEGDD